MSRRCRGDLEGKVVLKLADNITTDIRGLRAAVLFGAELLTVEGAV